MEEVRPGDDLGRSRRYGTQCAVALQESTIISPMADETGLHPDNADADVDAAAVAVRAALLADVDAAVERLLAAVSAHPSADGVVDDEPPGCSDPRLPCVGYRASCQLGVTRVLRGAGIEQSGCSTRRADRPVARGNRGPVSGLDRARHGQPRCCRGSPTGHPGSVRPCGLDRAWASRRPGRRAASIGRGPSRRLGRRAGPGQALIRRRSGSYIGRTEARAGWRTPATSISNRAWSTASADSPPSSSIIASPTAPPSV